MKRIGIVNIDTSHPQGFSEAMAEGGLDICYDMVYNDGFRGDGEVEAFIKSAGLSGRAASIDELAEATDIGFIQSCDWSRHIADAMPFITRKKPVFIDKPLVGSFDDVARVRELVRRGAVILGSSSARYAAEVQEFLEKPVSERGEVVALFGTSGVDEFNYGIHIAEIMTELAGSRAVSCKFTGRAEVAGSRCEMYCASFKNGVRATYYTYLSGWRPFHVSIMTTTGVYSFTIDSTKIYRALLERVSDALCGERGHLADVETILNATELMLCGKRSRDEAGGAEVLVSELHSGDAFDGKAFYDSYSAHASVLYK